jgi:Tol biopolymer transport system component
MTPKIIFNRDHERFGGRLIAVPRLSYNGDYLAFASDRKSRWTVWVFNRKTRRSQPVGPGCEPFWRRDNKSLLFVERAVSQAGRGIYLAKRPWKQPTLEVLVDNGPPKGHEYFPALTEDESVLYYSDSAQSPLQYQLYAKDLKTGEVVRLTEDSFDNRWPKPVRILPTLTSGAKS